MNFLRTYIKSILLYGLVVSGVSALGEWISFAWLVYHIHLQYVLASVVAFILGTSINSVLSRRLAFQSRGRSGVQETFLIFLTSTMAFALNISAMSCAVEIFGLNVMVGKITGTVAAFFANYLLRQFFIFSSEPRWK